MPFALLSHPPGTPLPLANDGALELFFLGTGGAFTPGRFQTNLIAVKGGAHVAIDFGSTAPLALGANAGLDANDIDVVLPTHLHADHVGGIEYLALHRRFHGSGRKARLIATPEFARRLWERTLRGGLEPNERRSDGTMLSLADFFVPHEPVPIPGADREACEITIDGLHLELIRTRHVPAQSATWRDAEPSFAVVIDRRVLFTGDTQFDPDLLEKRAGGCSLIIHDASFSPSPVHASLDELRSLPPQIKSRMLLSHYGNNAPAGAADGFAGMAREGVRYIIS
jgi:ribonuclease BN (tRNA processing enzyme)